MSFSFGFGGDDIEDDGNDVGMDVDEREAQDGNGPIAEAKSGLLKPFKIELEDMLSSLPLCLAFHTHRIPTDYGPGAYTEHSYPRRDLHDVRAQIMSTADPNNVDQVLEAGLSSSGDLNSGIYEGGFKTWECSNDLAWWMLEQGQQDDSNLAGSSRTDIWADGQDFLELGAGTGLASCVVLSELLRSRIGKGAAEAGAGDAQAADLDGRTILIADYNEAVLRMSTFPNIFLTWYCTLQPILRDSGKVPIPGPDDADPLSEGYLEITDELKTSFVHDMAAFGIKFAFVAGAWGSDFVTLAESCFSSSSADSHQLSATTSRRRCVMASETIYSLESLQAFVQTMTELIKTPRGHQSRAVVAAKKIYFGVGGGVDEFRRRLSAEVEVRRDWEGNVGIGRWIGEIMLRQS